MGYSFRLTARVILYAPSHKQNSTYHGLCYTSRWALAGMRNSSMGPPWRIDPITHRTMSQHSYHRATSSGTVSASYRLNLITEPLWEELLANLSTHKYTVGKLLVLVTQHTLWVHHEGSIRRPITPWANTTHKYTAGKLVVLATQHTLWWCDVRHFYGRKEKHFI